MKYGVYDLDRLIDTLRVHEDQEERFLALSVDGVHALEQFVLAKYYMTTQVYRHRVRLISDVMIARAISLGISVDGIAWLKALYFYDGSPEYVKEYLDWNDERLMSNILDKSTPDGYAKAIFNRLIERRLLKRIFFTGLAIFEDPKVRKQVSESGTDFLQKLEEEVSQRYGFDRNLVIAKYIRVRPVGIPGPPSEGQITVLHPQGPRLIQDESILFKLINERLEIYAPVAYADDRDKKRRRREFFSEIAEVIRSLASPQSNLFEEKR